MLTYEAVMSCASRLSHEELVILFGVLERRSAPELAEILRLRRVCVDLILKRALRKVAVWTKRQLQQ